MIQTCSGKWVNLDEEQVKGISTSNSQVLIEYFGDDCIYVGCTSDYEACEERDRLARILNGDEPEKEAA